ncbi:MAG: c-type cytochrome [Planctomycetes bacterium]|nr:c-type cytochrome [Planctomycetota bacterium]
MTRLRIVALVLLLTGTASAQPPSLQEQLSKEGSASLARAARQQGDAQRGAIVFHQPFLACTKCHTVGQANAPQMLGPDLTRPEPGTTPEALIESVLEPSKVLRKGFETIVVQLTDGKSLTGSLVEETADNLVLRDATRIGETLTILKSQIEERVNSKTSIMPAGQVNVLANRQLFLDLARYLIEIAEGGAPRARQLQPPPSLFTYVLPEYEKQIDHAGMLRSLDDKSFQRGEAIYNRLCINCHGTKEQPGSLPTSLKFAEGKFKNGHDPLRMYQTLTHGFGLMAPQTWMVPQQKYDVIHFVRETYLKPYNPSQYAAIDAAYLASLPPGTTRGPAPSNVEPWSSMNYGPYLMATYEVGDDGSNFAYKGIATRLDPGPGGVSRGKQWQVFDHDTLRVAAAWSHDARAGQGTEAPNFIDWHGINFDGRHQIHPRVAGLVQFANPNGPGWAHPETGTWDDPRLLGRDKKHYGPLPREWGQYRGLYQFGDQVIVSYTVGSTDVLEMPGAQSSVFTRTFQIGPRSRPMQLKVATHPSGKAKLELVSPDDNGNSGGKIAILSPGAKAATEVATTPSFGGQTRLAVQHADDFNLTSKDFSITARIRTRTGGTILCQGPIDGPWAPDGKTLFVRGGRLTFDIGWVGAVAGKTNVADDRWHDVAMTWQHETGRVRLFVDGKPDGQGTLKPKGKPEKQTIRLGFTSANFPDPSFFVGQMTDVRFVQRELKDEEVAEVSQLKSDQLLAHWKLDSLTAETIPDDSGHGHDGKLIGGFGPAPLDESKVRLAAGLSPMPAGAKWVSGDGGALILSLPTGTEPLKFVLSVTTASDEKLEQKVMAALVNQAPLDLASMTRGGPRRWLEELTTDVVIGPDSGPYAVDILTIPANNPWFAQLRLTGFDFFADGDSLAVCTWDGDVWVVSGFLADEKAPQKPLKWRRIANGLFQPLGLKILNQQIYVTCRDQIAILRDVNGDGETDFVECFNNDHQVTEHFHEFAMGLQADEAGNLYYAKSGRHALPAVVPHHGTLLRVSKDGSQTDILANGFRAANGVCLNPDGTFVVTDQEGFWNPKNRINWVTPAKPGERPRFYGNLFGYTDVTDPSDDAMEPPLCWITNAFDRSPAELLWVDTDQWGPLKGSLLNLSYGYGKVFVVPFEKVAPVKGDTVPRVQGGMCELPLPIFPTGIMRGRFHLIDGQLYTCGLFAWAGNATQPGGFYRIRATGRPVHLPIGLHARKTGMEIQFSADLDPATATDPSRYTVRTWSLKRTANYGSKHYDEKSLAIASVQLSDDHRTVTVNLPDIQPTWSMSIEYKLTGSQGEPVNGLIHNTIHELGK